MEDQIITWIETKDFDQLSLSEQQTVLQSMTEEEYHTHRRIILSMETEALAPDPEILVSLKQEIHNRKPKTVPFWVVIQGLMAWRIPAYQPAFVMVIVLLLVWWSRPEVVIQDPITQIVHDTIIHEVTREMPVEVPVEKVVRVVEYVPVETTTQLIVSTDISDQLDDGIDAPAVMPQLDDIVNSFGNTSVDAAALNQFRVGM